uniref:(northern house mosquito) hypothetical protein n=1 Tax=Culex pipiens TaxID=7175 RepID=A0A8D8JDS0_CULPI
MKILGNGELYLAEAGIGRECGQLSETVPERGHWERLRGCVDCVLVEEAGPEPVKRDRGKEGCDLPGSFHLSCGGWFEVAVFDCGKHPDEFFYRAEFMWNIEEHLGKDLEVDFTLIDVRCWPRSKDRNSYRTMSSSFLIK